jgi:hypothetical protein
MTLGSEAHRRRRIDGARRAERDSRLARRVVS